MKVLIVDDEVRYRDYLSQALSQRGHETETADNGQTGVDAGVRFQPDVLIADWLLKNQLHGLHVSGVLRTVVPHLRTVLITGFPSRDLEVEAQDLGVYRLVQKPFDLDELVDTVEAAAAHRPNHAAPAVATLEVGEGNRIVSHNQKAADLLMRSAAHTLADVLDEESLQHLDACDAEWTQLRSKSPASRAWLARSRALGDRRLFVFIDAEEQRLRRDPFIERLLGIRRRRHPWPFKSHVLVIDDTRMMRRVIVEELESAGCVCYKAETRELALQILAADEKIGVVVIDFSMPEIDVPELVTAIREARPDVQLVGNSTFENRYAFEMIGVTRFLLKPWTTEQLVEALNSD